MVTVAAARFVMLVSWFCSTGGDATAVVLHQSVFIPYAMLLFWDNRGIIYRPDLNTGIRVDMCGGDLLRFRP